MIISDYIFQLSKLSLTLPQLFPPQSSVTMATSNFSLKAAYWRPCRWGMSSVVPVCVCILTEKLWNFSIFFWIKLFSHASENISPQHNGRAAANKTGHSLFQSSHKEGGSGLDVHTKKVNNEAKSCTLKSLLSGLSSQVCCASGEISVTPVQRHWDIWPKWDISDSKFFYHSTPKLTSSIGLGFFWHLILPSSFSWHCFSHSPL